MTIARRRPCRAEDGPVWPGWSRPGSPHCRPARISCPSPTRRARPRTLIRGCSGHPRPSTGSSASGPHRDAARRGCPEPPPDSIRAPGTTEGASAGFMPRPPLRASIRLDLPKPASIQAMHPVHQDLVGQQWGRHGGESARRARCGLAPHRPGKGPHEPEPGTRGPARREPGAAAARSRPTEARLRRHGAAVAAPCRAF